MSQSSIRPEGYRGVRLRCWNCHVESHVPVELVKDSRTVCRVCGVTLAIVWRPA